MAIKLEVTSTSNSNRNYMEAPSNNQSGNFGKQSRQLSGLPNINIDGNFNAAMTSANNMGKAYDAMGQLVQKIGDELSAYTKAQDQLNGQKLLLDLNEKRAKLSTDYLEKASRGEITFESAVDNTYKEFESLYQDTISNTEFSNNDIRDEVFNRARSANINAFETDKKSAIYKTTERLKDSVNEEIQIILNSASNDVASLVGAANILNTQYSNDKRIFIQGKDHFERVKEIGLQNATRKLLTNELSVDPYKAERNLNDGVYDALKQYLPENEWEAFKTDIRTKKLSIEAQNHAIRERESNDQVGEIRLAIVEGRINTIAQLKEYGTKLTPNDMASLENVIIEKQKDILEINQSREIYGSGIGFNDSQRQKDFQVRYVPTIQEARDNPQKLKSLFEIMESDYGIGKVPEQFFSLIKDPKPGTELEHSKFIVGLNLNHKEAADKLPKSTIEVAYLIATERKPDGNSYTFAEAQQLLQERKIQNQNTNTEEDKKIISTFSDDSPYKKPEEAIRGKYGLGDKAGYNFSSTLDKDIPIPPQAIIDFRKELVKVARTHPNLDKDQQTSLAMTNSGWSISDAGSRLSIVKTAENPRTIIQDSGMYEGFKKRTTEYADDKKVKNYSITKNPVGDGFIMFDNDKGIYVSEGEGGKPKVFYANPVDKVPVKTKTTGFMNSLSHTQNRLKIMLDDTQSKFPELNQFPGLLFAITGPETSGGKIKNKSETGAFGIGQFTPGTAKQYGLTENSTQSEQAIAMGKYMSDLLKANNGDIIKSLKVYSGYYSMAKPAGTIIGYHWDDNKKAYDKSKPYKSVGPEQAHKNFMSYLGRMRDYGFTIPAEAFVEG